jgi:hypothetical protein
MEGLSTGIPHGNPEGADEPLSGFPAPAGNPLGTRLEWRPASARGVSKPPVPCGKGLKISRHERHGGVLFPPPLLTELRGTSPLSEEPSGLGWIPPSDRLARRPASADRAIYASSSFVIACSLGPAEARAKNLTS